MGNTPKSDKTISDQCESPQGVKRGKVYDGESRNACEAFDGSKPVFPLGEVKYLKDANGQN